MTKLGTELYEKFIKEQETTTEISIWDTMTKKKLITFRSTVKTLFIQLKDKVIRLKEEKNLIVQSIYEYTD